MKWQRLYTAQNSAIGNPVEFPIHRCFHPLWTCSRRQAPLRSHLGAALASRRCSLPILIHCRCRHRGGKSEAKLSECNTIRLEQIRVLKAATPLERKLPSIRSYCCKVPIFLQVEWCDRG